MKRCLTKPSYGIAGIYILANHINKLGIFTLEAKGIK